MIASSYFSAKNVSAQGYFYPPRVSYSERTGLYSGLLTTGLTEYDGLTCFQTGSGQALFVVQSGIWRQASLV